MIDYKEYSKQMRENAVIDNNGNIIVSDELWQQIAYIIEKQQAEIDRLEVFAKIATQRSNDYRAMRNKAKTARAEAIKEFAEKLKEKADVWEDDEFYFKYVTTEEIDNLVKEMVGVE